MEAPQGEHQRGEAVVTAGSGAEVGGTEGGTEGGTREPASPKVDRIGVGWVSVRVCEVSGE